MRSLQRYLLLCLSASVILFSAEAQNLSVKPIKSEEATKIHPTKRLWLAMSIATYTVASLDMHATAAALDKNKKLPGFYLRYPEGDPLARPFTELPRPAYYACGFAVATGVNWLGYKMSKSRRWRRVWWLPQAVSISGNSYGYQSQRIN